MIPDVNTVVIESISPEIDGGRLPIKRVVGDELEVTATIFSHGHELLIARLLHRERGARKWRESPMEPGANDRWKGSFSLERNGYYEYSVLAWRDPFLSWRDDLQKRIAAGQDVLSELREGLRIVEDSLDRASTARDRELVGLAKERIADRIAEQTAETRASGLISSIRQRAGALGDELGELERIVNRAFQMRIDDSQNEDQRLLSVLMADRLTAAMERCADRSDGGRYGLNLRVYVDRRQAEYASWYEMWARSQGKVEGQSATFADMTARLDEIQQMGFDVVYLPPIHPIGVTDRKGPNNSLECPAGSPGCPYAIGSSEGGHTEVHPELGTIADFDAFVAACDDRGMEVALDYALQASPDHPWVKDHPDWFYRRPDGTIKFAENPPKKYQDVYPLNFNTKDRAGLWQACLEVLRFWIQHGVKTFRVDNPHTKPVQFWQWLIAEVQAENPDVIFLAEAFTRPTMMRALAKAGFTQSYTYFTWRNFKAEIEEYFTELTQGEDAEYMRGNLFTNTPDILPRMLQNAPAPAFMVRATLAATLSSVWGMYNGFELCEGTPVPGKEEYLASEKYDYKVWDWDRPGNIKSYITLLNKARREQSALQSYRNLRFCSTDDDHVLCYYKASEDGESVVVTVVNLDPYQSHETLIHLPLLEMGIEANENYQMHDLVSNERFIWHGPTNYVKLDPRERVAHVFRLLRWSHREQDFDYYL